MLEKNLLIRSENTNRLDIPKACAEIERLQKTLQISSVSLDDVVCGEDHLISSALIFIKLLRYEVQDKNSDRYCKFNRLVELLEKLQAAYASQSESQSSQELKLESKSNLEPTPKNESKLFLNSNLLSVLSNSLGSLQIPLESSGSTESNSAPSSIGDLPKAKSHAFEVKQQTKHLSVSAAVEAADDPNDPDIALIRVIVKATLRPESKETGKNVFLLLDKSSSMSEPIYLEGHENYKPGDPDNVTRFSKRNRRQLVGTPSNIPLDALKKSVEKLINDLSKNDKVFVICFDKEVTILNIEPTDHKGIKAAIMNLKTVHGTNITAAIETLTRELFPDPEASTILIFLDGKATVNKKSPQELIAKRQEAFDGRLPPRICIGFNNPALEVLKIFAGSSPYLYAKESENILDKITAAKDFITHSVPVRLGYMPHTGFRKIKISSGDFVSDAHPFVSAPIPVYKRSLKTAGFFISIGEEVHEVPGKILLEATQKSTKADSKVLSQEVYIRSLNAELEGIRNFKTKPQKRAAIPRLLNLLNKIQDESPLSEDQAPIIQGLKQLTIVTLDDIKEKSEKKREKNDLSFSAEQSGLYSGSRTQSIARSLKKREPILVGNNIYYNYQKKEIYHYSGENFIMVDHKLDFVTVVGDYKPTTPGDMPYVREVSQAKKVVFVDHSNTFLTLIPVDPILRNISIDKVESSEANLLNKVASLLREAKEIEPTDPYKEPTLIPLSKFLAKFPDQLPDHPSHCRQYAALSAYLLAKKAREDNLQNPDNPPAQIFVYRSTADNFQAHAWVIKKQEKQGSKIFLLDATNDQQNRVFELTDKDQLRGAIAYYANRGLPGILRSLCKRHNLDHEPLTELLFIPFLSELQMQYFSSQGWVSQTPLGNGPIVEPGVIEFEGFCSPPLDLKALRVWHADERNKGKNPYNPAENLPDGWECRHLPQMTEAMLSILKHWSPAQELATLQLADKEEEKRSTHPQHDLSKTETVTQLKSTYANLSQKGMMPKTVAKTPQIPQPLQTPQPKPTQPDPYEKEKVSSVTLATSSPGAIQTEDDSTSTASQSSIQGRG